MCGIIGLFNVKNIEKKIKKGLKLIKYRGRDSSNYIIRKNNAIGHNLHAIINHVPQPLKNKFAANCEIYNWEELNKNYELRAKNDAEVILRLIEKIGIEKTLDKLDGVYAFVYWDNEKVYLARDIIGVKPIWFSHKEDSFSFCSEKKVLENLKFEDVIELNPRKILSYDLKKKSLKFKERKFFKTKPELNISYDSIKRKLKKKFLKAIKKRIPNQRVGILFSGGIDSTIIAFLLKEMGVDFICYTAALDEVGMDKAQDLEFAEEIAKKYGFKLRIAKTKLKEIPNKLKIIVPLLEDSNVVKVGVALPFFLSCELAKKDKIKVIFSGVGSEEIFAGYERHEFSYDINEECVYGLKQTYQRDLYRDDVVTMFNNVELRVPFFDYDLVKFALKIPSKYKIKDLPSGKRQDKKFENGIGIVPSGSIKKFILRDLSLDLGLDKKYAFRRKKAAQYGSKFDKAIMKLSKKQGKTKSEYLRQFYPSHNLKIGALLSSGKDSIYAIYILQKMNYEISCCITMVSENKDSYMFHTPNIGMADLQSKAMGIPLLKVRTKGEKEKELADLKKAIFEAKKSYNLDGIVTGAIFSTYQRNRVEKICEELGLKVFAPLWHKDQEELMRELLNINFKIIFSSIAGDGLTEKWINKIIDMDDVYELININEKIGTNIAGEGGEFESLVLDCPLFKQKIKIKESIIKMDNECTGRLIIKSAELSDK